MENSDFNVPWGPCLSRSDSLLDGICSSSSPETPMNFRHATVGQLRCGACTTKPRPSQFEEKFKLRENIILGCDTITELTDKVSYLQDMRYYAEYIHGKTLQAQPQNVCAKWGGSDEELITEYVKTFIKISDAWLSVRNCFGHDGRCLSKVCCLDVKDLSANYVDWMHSSRQLLQSIMLGLQKVNISCKRNAGLQLNPPSAGYLWGYPPNAPCHCSLQADAKPPGLELVSRNPPALPSASPPPAFSNMEINTGDGDYMTPSSYDIPRNNLTQSYKSQNIAKAKSEIYRELPNCKIYAIQFTQTIVKPDTKFLHKTVSEGSFEFNKDLGEPKSDSDGNFSKKDIGKKNVKKAWIKRRQPAENQENSTQDLCQNLRQLNFMKLQDETDSLSGQ